MESASLEARVASHFDDSARLKVDAARLLSAPIARGIELMAASLKAGGKVTRAKLATLVDTIRVVLEEAIEAGGSTLRDFAATDGALGYFQHRFRAYGRENEPCLTPACRGVIRRKVQGGRSTFYCPVCQK